MPAAAPAPAAPALLPGLAVLLLCQSAGEALSRLAHLPLPGPVLGMLALVALVALLAWPPVRALVGGTADALLGHLSLLFVPVGVGVMTHLPLITQYGSRIALVLLLSTWAGLAVTALVLQALLPADEARAP
jgi:holin-like protein